MLEIRILPITYSVRKLALFLHHSLNSISVESVDILGIHKAHIIPDTFIQ